MRRTLQEINNKEENDKLFKKEKNGKSFKKEQEDGRRYRKIQKPLLL